MILQMHAPEMAGNAEVTKEMQKQLIEVQKTDQAWGLTEGLLHHPVSHVVFFNVPHVLLMHERQSPIVRFFGAQNAQTKIARDWQVLHMTSGAMSNILRAGTHCPPICSPSSWTSNCV